MSHFIGAKPVKKERASEPAPATGGMIKGETYLIGDPIPPVTAEDVKPEAEKEIIEPAEKPVRKSRKKKTE